MELDLKTFVQTLREGDTKKAREWLERTKNRVDPDDGFGRGYLLALRGMVAALESGGGCCWSTAWWAENTDRNGSRNSSKAHA